MEINKEIYKDYCRLCTEKHSCRGICIQVNDILVKEREEKKHD